MLNSDDSFLQSWTDVTSGAAHKKFISQVELEINVQLEDAESRIMAVQEVS